jgi:lipopolysaccharide transport system permease protein
MIVIESPGRRWSPVAALREYREFATLFRYLTLRDLRLRFQDRLLGILWVTVQPTLPALIFSFVFARLLQPSTGGVSYPLFALAGFVLWTFFSTSVSTASMTFVWNTNLLNKVYFPRAILPASAVLASSIELVVGSLLVVVWAMLAGYAPRPAWLLLPLICAYVAALAFVVSLGLAVLNALNRNVKFAVPFLMQIWIYASPVVYPATVIGKRFRWVLGLNPLTAALEGFRAALFGTAVDRGLILLSLVSACIAVAGSLALFRRYEAQLAEKL